MKEIECPYCEKDFDLSHDDGAFPGKPTCCNKCRNGAGKYQLAIAREYCLNSSCTCHKKLVIATRAKGKPIKVSVCPDIGLTSKTTTSMGWAGSTAEEVIDKIKAEAIRQRDEELREIISTKLKK